MCARVYSTHNTINYYRETKGFLNSNTQSLQLTQINLIPASALKDDFVLILHQDRKEHRIMSYINLMEQLTLAEQEETVKFLCNMCGNPGSFDWLMYISEVSNQQYL